MSDYDPNYVPIKNYFLLGVKLIILNKQGEILLLERSGKAHNPHSWDFPGGGVDSGESFEVAAKRELYEETGLSFSHLQALGSLYTLEKGEDDAIIFGFSAAVDSSDVVLSWEHESYRWARIDEILTMNLPSLHTKIIEYYVNNKKDS